VLGCLTAAMMRERDDWLPHALLSDVKETPLELSFSLVRIADSLRSLANEAKDAWAWEHTMTYLSRCLEQDVQFRERVMTVRSRHIARDGAKLVHD
jgi:hypothetical protein